MSEELKHEVVLGNSTLGEYYKTTPSHLVLLLTEKSVARLQAARKAYELAASQFPTEVDVYGVEVSFHSFDYMVEDEDADVDAGGEQPLKQWNDNWEVSKVRVNRDGFRFKADIKHADVGMETDMLTFAHFEEEVRKFRSLQLGASIEGAMPEGEGPPAPAKSSGFSPI